MDFKDKETLISIPIGHFATFAQGKATMRGHEELLWEESIPQVVARWSNASSTFHEFLGVFLGMNHNVFVVEGKILCPYLAWRARSKMRSREVWQKPYMPADRGKNLALQKRECKYIYRNKWILKHIPLYWKASRAQINHFHTDCVVEIHNMSW